MIFKYKSQKMKFYTKILLIIWVFFLLSLNSWNWQSISTWDNQVWTGSNQENSSLSWTKIISWDQIQLNIQLNNIELLDNSEKKINTYLDQKNAKLKQIIDAITWEVFTNSWYGILLEIWEIDYQNPYNNILSWYLNLKLKFITDLNILKSQRLILEEKKNLWLIDLANYNIESKNLTISIENLNNTYNTLIDDFFNNSNKELQIFSWNLYDTFEKKEWIINDFINIKQKFDDLVNVYNEYKKLEKKIKNIYVWDYANIKTFIKESINTIMKILNDDLKSQIYNSYNVNSNIDNYSWDIQNYLELTKNSYSKELETYFDSLFSWFYNVDDVNFVEINYNFFLNSYYNSWYVNYKKVYENFKNDDNAKKLSDKLNELKQLFENQLTFLKNPEDIEDIKKFIINDINKKYLEDKKNNLEKIKSYLWQIDELVELKIEKQNTKLEQVVQQINDLSNLTWENIDIIYEKYDNFQNQLKNIKQDTLDLTLKWQLDKKYWEIEIMKINLLLDNNIYNSSKKRYKDLDTKLDQIILDYKQDMIKNNKLEKFNKKTDKALETIENYLSVSQISSNTRFLTLYIKKAIIKQKYLN